MNSSIEATFETAMGFNTASGKYYCNSKGSRSRDPHRLGVSIPQAVSTIAMSFTHKTQVTIGSVSIPQAVSTIAIVVMATVLFVGMFTFQYRKR